MTDDPEDHFIQSVYRVMILYGFDLRNEVRSNYKDEESGGRIFLAIPSMKVGLSTVGDNPGPFIDDGWYIQNMVVQHMQVFHSVFKIGRAHV